MKTVQGLGYAYNPDFNGAHQRGVGFMQHTIDGVTRRRCNAAEAFLAPVLGDPRLTIVTEASATGIVIENGRAIGVRYSKAAWSKRPAPDRGHPDAAPTSRQSC